MPLVAHFQNQRPYRPARDDIEPVGRLVEDQIVRLVDQGPAEGDLELLAARIAARATIGKAGHVELVDEGIDSVFQIVSGEALEFTVEADMFAPGKAGIKTTDVGQDPEPLLHRKTILRDIDGVHANRTLVR